MRIFVRRRPRHVSDIVIKPRQAVVRLRQRSLILEISSTSFVRWLQKYWVRAGVGVAVIASLVVLVSRNVGRANVATLYPTACLGGWENPQLAEGKPDVDGEKADAELFTSLNSAQLKASAAQIFCGSFKGEVPQEVEPKKVLLKLSWAVLGAAPTVPASGEAVPLAPPAEAPPVIIEGTVKPEQVESIIDSAEGQSAELHIGEPAAEAPAVEQPSSEPAPLPEPAPTPETSWLPWRVAIAAAQELEAISTGDGSTAAATAAAIDSSSTAEKPTPSPDAIVPVEPDPKISPAEPIAPPADAPFLQLLYTLDGKDWVKLADVTAANWQGLAVELPLKSWDELATVQISLQTVPSLAEQPVVLLDSMRLEVEYQGDAASVAEQPDFARDTVLQLLHAQPYYAMNIFSASRQRHELWIYEDLGSGGWQRPAVEPDYAFDQPIALQDNTLFFVGQGGQTMNAYDATSRIYSSQTIDSSQSSIALAFGRDGKRAQWSAGSAELGTGRFTFSVGDSQLEDDQSNVASLSEFLAKLGGSASLIDVSNTEATTTAESTSTAAVPVDVVPVDATPAEAVPAEPEPPVALPEATELEVAPEPEPTLTQEQL